MRFYIIQARSLYEYDGRRRFIIPFNDGTIEVLTKSEALALKASGQLPADFTAKTIYNACFFYTNTRASHEKVQSEMPMRERNRRMKYYYKWFTNHHTK